jgi:hypothetical protein
MRVATTLTGVAACAAAVAPAGIAQAATHVRHTGRPDMKVVDLGPAAKAGLRVRVPGFMQHHVATPDNSPPNLNYSLGITITGVSRVHVCGWHGTGTWRCTVSASSLIKSHVYRLSKVGGNKRSWRRGLTEVYWNGGGAGNWDQCNTNGSYNGFTGYFSSTGGLHEVYSPNYVWLSPVGPGHPTC